MIKQAQAPDKTPSSPSHRESVDRLAFVYVSVFGAVSCDTYAEASQLGLSPS